MKRILTISAFLFTTLFVLNNCKKEEIVSVNGIVSGKIYDASTQSGLAEVTVNVKGTNVTGTTKSDGTFEVSGVPAGEYTIVFTKSGFMISKAIVSIGFSSITSKKSLSVDYPIIMDDIYLYPLTGKASGVVFNEDGTLSSAVTVKISVQDSIFSTTTDANGEFSFATLPFRPNYSLGAFAIKGSSSGYDYDSYQPSSSSSLAFSIHLTKGTFKFLYGNYMKNINSENFNISSNIELTFSENIDLSSTLKYGNITLYNNSIYGSVGIDITSNGKKLIINPKRDLARNSDYHISGNVYTSENNYVYINENFSSEQTTTVTPLNTTTKPTIVMNGTKTLLTITPPTGSTYLYLYKAGGANAEFIFYDDLYVGTSTAVTHSINLDASGTSYYVIAKGYDLYGRSVFGVQSDIVTK